MGAPAVQPKQVDLTKLFNISFSTMKRNFHSPKNKTKQNKKQKQICHRSGQVCLNKKTFDCVPTDALRNKKIIVPIVIKESITLRNDSIQEDNTDIGEKECHDVDFSDDISEQKDDDI